MKQHLIELPPGGDRSALHLKFVEGSQVRLRDGRFTSFGNDDLTGLNRVLDRHRGTRASRLFDRAEHLLAADKRDLEAHSLREQADFNLYYRLRVPPSVDTLALLNDLNALPLVEIAYPQPLPAPPPAGDYEDQQFYRDAAPDGIDVGAVDGLVGARGNNVRIFDIEYSWNVNHEDLPAARASGATVANKTATDPFNSNDHGTAVLGEMVAADNGFGVTGLVPDARIGMVNANNAEDGYDLQDAITLARTTGAAGDVILIEQQTSGATACVNSVSGCVAVEYVQAYYDAIVAATSAGRIVVEAAGNGNEDLDSAAYLTTFGTRPDSGAIIVGAAEAPGCSAPAHGRRASSTFGSRVDLHAYGECVATTGYGGLFGSSQSNDAYTATFSGTSSASPIVASAAAVLSSVAQATGDADGATSVEARTALVAGATPQATGGTARTGNIGPMPDLRSALSGYLPTAHAGGPYATVEGQNVVVDASGSSAPGGGSLTYAWDLDDDGAFDDGTGATATFARVGDEGVFDVAVRVRATNGGQDTARTTVGVTNAAPTVQLTPTSGSEGSDLGVTGLVVDEGWLDHLTATIDWGDGSGAQPLPGSLEQVPPRATLSFSGTHRYGDDGSYTVTVCGRDDQTQTCTSKLLVVSNQAPELALDGEAIVIDEGDTATLTGSYSDVGWLDTHTGAVAWGTGDTTAATLDIVTNGPPTRSGALSAAHAYGDDGSFTAAVTVDDDDGGTAQDDVAVTVRNVAPTAVVDTSAAMSISGVPTLFARAGEPLDLAARSTDPGSDDLTLRWDFGDGATTTRTSLVSPPSNDGAPSPSVQPRDEEDAVAHVYADACARTARFTATDDDSGEATHEIAVLIIGNAIQRHNDGWWYQQVRGVGSAFSGDQLACLLDGVGFLSQVFSEARDASTAAAATEVYRPQGPTIMRHQLDRKLLTALLNLVAGGIGYAELVDTDGDGAGDRRFHEVLAAAEAARLDPASTTTELEWYKDLLERINGGA